MYYFYINNVLLPVTPSELSIKVKNQNKVVNLVDGSEFNVVKLPGLSEISFDCVLPNTKYPFAVYENDVFLNGNYFLSLFEELKTARTVFKFRVIRREGFGNTSFDCTIEDYTIKEDASSGFDFTVTVKLKEYIYRKTAILNFTSQSDNAEVIVEEERTVNKQAQTIQYTIVSGDTLWGIAKKHYGDGSKYSDIYEENKEAVENAAKANGRASSSNGHWIYPGTVIVLKDALI